MISTGELKKGVTIEMDGQIYQVLDYQHLKLGRGSAQVRMRLRHIRAGHIIERSVQAGEKFPRVYLEHRKVQFHYRDGDQYYFMDTETFDQITMVKDSLEGTLDYLKEGMTLEVVVYKDEPIGIELPITVDLAVAEAEPGFKGDTATSGGKPARLETGLLLQVPLFVNVGDVVRVDTRTGSYVERVG
ncbi:MAG: elongation factor P [Chloroflexi bacterium]|nr:elongation factor P [Chloroflexota bacterium]